MRRLLHTVKDIIEGIVKQLTGIMSVSMTDAIADSLSELTLYGGTSQTGTPTPTNPIDIVCNNGAIKVNGQGQIYTDGTTETVEDELGNTATAEMLLKIGDYQDEQEVLSGNVTRRVGVKVLNGTESRSIYSVTQGTLFRVTLPDTFSGQRYLTSFCSHFPVVYSSSRTDMTMSGANRNADFIYSTYADLASWKAWLSQQYNNGTPVIIVYELEIEVTETVTAQTLNVGTGSNTIEITQASLNNLELEIEYTGTDSI